ncbi:MAG: spermidine/putrescine ABC transporter substrate-binding protein [Aquiluna sp.]|nr:spermidine/putrescine ABC transporter substrate-binding protein [Aquiluna sp.]MCF8546048.1 spermidine/putrescine ABC transporter substrate-binding protein [Aquiluna sp.]
MKQGLPQDPMMRQLVLMARHNMTRRAALAGLGGTAAALSLASCAPAGESALTPAADLSDSEKVLTWHNWPLYMDEDDNGNYPTLDRFQAETGIAVDYLLEIDDNDTWYAKVKDQLALGQDIGADVASPTSWLVDRMIGLGYLQKMDDANMPNKVANLAPAYLGNANDPDRTLSVPYQGILGGIAYHKAAFKEATGKDAPTSVNDLWLPELKGRVGLLSEMRDTVGLVLMAQGIDIASADSLTEDAFNAAVEFIAAQVSSGQVFNIKGNSYAEDLKNGNIIAATAWSGDITIINFETESEDFGFVIPEEGATISADAFVIPMGAQHKKNAEALINYYYDPVNAAELAAWVNYVTPVVGAKEVLMETDPDLANNPLIFPDAELLSKTHSFRALTGQEEQRFATAWQNVLLGA